MSTPRAGGVGEAAPDPSGAGAADQGMDPIGVMVIRVWTEVTDPRVPAFRARVTWRPDVTSAEEETAVASSVEEVTAVVSRLIASFGADGAERLPATPVPDDPRA